MFGCRGFLLRQHEELQRRRFEKLGRRRPDVDRALCRWALGRGARLHTPHLRLHHSGGHLYARKAIELTISDKDKDNGGGRRLLFTVPMTTSIGLPGDPTSSSQDRTWEEATTSAPDSASSATAVGTAHARALREWLALSRAALTASLVDNDPRHVFAKAFVERAFVRASASAAATAGGSADAFSEGDFVEENDVCDTQEARDGRRGGGDSGAHVADCAVFTRTLSDARHPAACVFADRLQRALDSATLSAVQGVAPLVRPTMAAVLQAAVVSPPLPFEIIPFVDRIDPAASSVDQSSSSSSDANVELGCFVDSDFEPHFKVTATRVIQRGERLRMDFQCPVVAPMSSRRGRRGSEEEEALAAAVTTAGWGPMTAPEQHWVRFGRLPPLSTERPLR